MVREKHPLHFQEYRVSPDISHLGGGTIGSKARELERKTQLLKLLGFRANPRVFVGQEFLDEIITTNGLGQSIILVSDSDAIQQQLKDARCASDQKKALEKIAARFQSQHLAIRSSAEGDSHGTGDYKSVFVPSTANAIEVGIKEVLASYYSEDAMAFRRNGKRKEGFGIIIEPLIGQNLRVGFAPVLSGMGYTSTLRGEGYLSIVSGLGCGVETDEGHRITRSGMKEYNGNLIALADRERDLSMQGLIPQKAKHFFWLRMGDNVVNSGGNVFVNGSVESRGVDVEGQDAQTLGDFSIFPLFEMMGDIQYAFKSPQYLEWAMTIENGKPVYWIIQIGEVNTVVDEFDFADYGKAIFEAGEEVVGTGIRGCKTLVRFERGYSAEVIEWFNRNHSDYILVYDSSSASRGSFTGLNLRHCYNASAFVVIRTSRHAMGLREHLIGHTRESGQFFGVLEPTDTEPWKKLGNRRTERGLEIYEGDFVVVASEKNNRLVVYVKELEEEVFAQIAQS